MTVEQLMIRSLRMIIVAGAESSIDDSDAQDYIIALNNFVAQLEGESGVDLSWTAVTAVGDTVPIAGSMLRGLAALMAVEIAPDYGVTVSPEVQTVASDGLSHILRKGTTKTATQLPETLPVGSGNENDGTSLIRDHFFEISS